MRTRSHVVSGSPSPTTYPQPPSGDYMNRPVGRFGPVLLLRVQGARRSRNFPSFLAQVQSLSLFTIHNWGVNNKLLPIIVCISAHNYTQYVLVSLP